MNRFLIIFILLNICSLSALSFNATGLKIGYNSSRFTGNDIYGKGVSNIPGFIIGGFITYDINQHFAFDSELLLTTKGSYVNTIGDIDQHNVIVYLELPFACKYKFFNSTAITPTISCGSSFAINTLALNDTGILDNIGFYDICLLAATGFEFRYLSMELRFQQGIICIDGNSINNQTLSLQIGIKLLKENL
ncbi:MAG: outer membrane beta-barrel protein [Candidatus Stygibacter australis]|nr:outer membrane beta-barrel protein [Candidatus Stygibacter australis]MDP8321998.1 outer membrane beta-barrel protein [Candidatus Stygibacter australis]